MDPFLNPNTVAIVALAQIVLLNMFDIAKDKNKPAEI